MVSGNTKRNVKYGHIQVRLDALKQFKATVNPGETYTDAILRLIKQDKESKNRKCQAHEEPGIIET
jgi:hypothetical protein